MRHPKRYKYDENGKIVQICCSKCRVYKTPEEFYFLVSGMYDSYCTECRRRENRKHHKRLRETVYKGARRQKPQFEEDIPVKEEKWDGLLCPPLSRFARI